MKLEEFNTIVNNLIKEIPQELQKTNVIVAQSAIPLITNRLINEGKTAEGKSLGKYSDKPISALFFIGKSLGSGGDKKVSDYAKKNGGKLSYEEFRKLNGRPTNHVTLSFSGETLQDIGVLSTVVNGNKVKTVVGSLDRHKKDVRGKGGKKTGTIGTEQVLENLDAKYGKALDTELLALSKKEQDMLEKVYENRIQKFIDNYFK